MFIDPHFKFQNSIDCLMQTKLNQTFCSIGRSFAIDNHITVYPSNYRGRPVTSANIQDYISNIVSKYFPAGLPPWQICVIPVLGTQTSQRSEEPPSAVSPLPADSPSENDIEEEQQPSIDSPAVRHLYRLHFLSG